MSSLLTFWNDSHDCSALHLEAESWLRHLLNRVVVSPLVNTFPALATSVFRRGTGELARLFFDEKEGGSFRVLREMYAYETETDKGDWINRLMMQSPAVKAARNRRKIAQKMLTECLRLVPAGTPSLILALGSGDGTLELQVLSQIVGADGADLYYCGVDSDLRAKEAAEQTLRQCNLATRGLALTGTIKDESDMRAILRHANERFGTAFRGVDVTVCQGIAEYLDLGTARNDELLRLLRTVHAYTSLAGSLIISQTHRHDRVKYLERALGWHMRLRREGEFRGVVEEAGWHLETCAREPMNLITMCLARNKQVIPGLLGRDGDSSFLNLHPGAESSPSQGREEGHETSDLKATFRSGHEAGL